MYKLNRFFIMAALALLTAVPSLFAETQTTQSVTGTVQSVNPEARFIALNQIDPVSGQNKTLYVASVSDSDLTGADALDEVQVGQTITVRVTDMQNLTTAPAATAVVTQKTVKEDKRVKEDLFEDVGEIHHSSLGISN
jgi:hypothetical protein